MAGKVQMIYFDPPCGIKCGSSFQPFVNKHGVKDGSTFTSELMAIIPDSVRGGLP